MQVHGDIHQSAPPHRIGLKADVFLVKFPEALVHQERRDARPFPVERIDVERSAIAERQVGRVGHDDVIDGLVLDVVAHVSDDERLPWLQRIDGLEAPPLDLSGVLHLRIQVSHVLDGHEEVPGGEPGLQSVVDHRFLPDFVQCAVDPLGAVISTQGIYGKGYLDQRKPFGIGPLPYVLLQVLGIEILVIGLDLHTFEQILALRDEP